MKVTLCYSEDLVPFYSYPYGLVYFCDGWSVYLNPLCIHVWED